MCNDSILGLPSGVASVGSVLRTGIYPASMTRSKTADIGDVLTEIPLGLVSVLPKAFREVVLYCREWPFRSCRSHCS